MPYIPQSIRPDALRAPVDAGELAFALTSVILDYMNGMPERFKSYAEVMGVLECVKLEIYRRRISPYEDQKIKLNGDLF